MGVWPTVTADDYVSDTVFRTPTGIPMATPAAVTSEVRPRRSALSVAKSYFLLTKPRIIELLLITTVPSMIVAQASTPQGGLPSWQLVLATLIGGSLAAGAANTVNCWFDRDIDAIMARTRNRPLPRGDVSPNGALVFAAVLQVLSFVWLGLAVNWLSAFLGLSATLFYVFVYTIGLKRSSPQNIVIGGAAGAVPVLIGWSAVTGTVPLASWVAFALIFYWTPPHFWALAIKYRDDYAAAGVPMLPVVETIETTARQILRYSWLMVAISLLFFAVAQMGLIYLVSAVVLGAVFLKMAIDLRRDPSVRKAMRLFHYSISYLGLLFVSMAVDAAVIA